MKLKIHLFLIVIFAAFLSGHAQNPAGFNEMVDNHIKGTVPVINPKECNFKNIVYLDARELEEFNVSHIPNAVYVGYDRFDWKALESINKDAQIVVYCSIGYRSEKIGEKLLDKGYTNVYNMYGGIFNWSNNGLPIVDRAGNTKRVHGYSESWSKWLNESKVDVVTGKKK
jgi:rhodanese-related sulfurtransferase